MDIDVFIGAHRAEWDRLEALIGRAGRLRGEEADELVRLYQRVATHLSVVRSVVPDAALIARLSSLLAQARSAVTGTHSPAWREFGLFFARRLPAALYLGARWWVPTAVLVVIVAGVVAAWVAGDPGVPAALSTPEEIRELVRPGGSFETYYSSEPAAAFAAHVWTNNAWVAAGCLLLGVLLGVPVIVILWLNALNLGISAGLMAAAGRLDVFFGLITPHGLLELTAVFVAAGIGMKLGWTVIDPGGLSRGEALAREGRSVVIVVLGLALVLLVSGVIEAFVTPSGLPTAARIAIGVAAELLFLAYVFIVGRRAARAGVTGDLDKRFAGDTLPTAG